MTDGIEACKTDNGDQLHTQQTQAPALNLGEGSPGSAQLEMVGN